MKIIIQRWLYRPALVTPILLLVSEMGSFEFNLFDAIRLVALKGVQHAMASSTLRGTDSTRNSFISEMGYDFHRMIFEFQHRVFR
jgi:hypothetical protein